MPALGRLRPIRPALPLVFGSGSDSGSHRSAWEIGSALAVNRRTVMRWAQSEHAPSLEHLAKLEELSELRHLLATVFPDPDACSQWLHTPVPALRGRTPMAFIRRGDLQEVIGVLAGLEAGAFA